LTRPRLLLLLLIALAPALAAPLAAAEPPSVAFTVEPERPVIEQPVYFNATAYGQEEAITNWTWRLGDGTLAHGPNVVHQYAVTGEYIVELTAYDAQGQPSYYGRRIVLFLPLPDHGHAPLDSFLPGWLYWTMPLIVSVILGGFAYLVVYKGQPAIYNFVFFLFYADSALKSFTEAFAVLTAGTGSNLHLGMIAVNRVTSYLLAPLFLWFVLVFPRPVHSWFAEGKRGAIALLLAIPFLANDVFGVVDRTTHLNVFNITVSVIALLCLVLLIYHGWETDSDEEHRRVRLLAFTFFLLVASALILSALNLVHSIQLRGGDPESAEFYLQLTAAWGLVLSPFLEVIGSTILLYAILRWQLLGVEGLVVRLTRTTFVVLLVPSMFITLGNALENLLEATVLADFDYEYIIAGFISAVLMIPVQKWVVFITHRLFPGSLAKDAHEESRRRMEIFESQLRYSLLDGALNDKETNILRRLMLSVQLRPDELRTVLARFPQVDGTTFEAAAFLQRRPGT
jgi:hypothetical protein